MRISTPIIRVLDLLAVLMSLLPAAIGRPCPMPCCQTAKVTVQAPSKHSCCSSHAVVTRLSSSKCACKLTRPSTPTLTAAKTTVVVPFEHDVILLDPVITFVSIEKRKPAAPTPTTARKAPKGALGGIRVRAPPVNA